MKKTAGLILVILFIATTLTVDAQRWKLRRYELTLGMAATNFYSDVGKSVTDQNFIKSFKTIQLDATRPSISASLRYKLTGDMAAKLNLTYGYLHGRDAGNLENREYIMTTTIFEPSLVFEYYPLPEGRPFSSAALFNRRGMINNYSKIYVYLFGGVGGSIYSAKAKQMAETEDRFVPGSGFAAVFPVGAGIKYTIDAAWSIGFEFGRRYTLTDKLDGITTQFSKNNDIYDFAVISAIYKVRTDRRGRPIFRSGYRR
ncbi:MAG: DUF6089 family protein [Bacteroidales bacterium]